MSEFTIAHKFKFVWAPFLDEYDTPIFSALFTERGDRRLAHHCGPVDKQSIMTAISEMGYHVGTLAAGAGALLLADRYGWRSADCMAALMTLGAISAFVAPESKSDFTVSHRHSGFVVAPIKEMVRRLDHWPFQSSS